MTAGELREALKTLRWSQAELSRRLGLNVNTVSNWMRGKAPVPDYASAYVNLVLKVKRLSDEL